MEKVQIRVCDWNCICKISSCKKFHAIPESDDRNIFREKIYSSINVKDYNETDPEGVRRAPCRKGQICDRKNCNFQHRINAEGREILIKKWYQERKKLKVLKLIKDLEDDSISKEDAAKVLKDIWGIKEEKKEKKSDEKESDEKEADDE
jgi:hypothetical protein